MGSKLFSGLLFSKIFSFCTLLFLSVFVYGQVLESAFPVPGGKYTRDSNHNTIVSGELEGSFDFDPGSGEYILTTKGALNTIWFAKYDANGEMQWINQLSGNEYAYIQAIRADKTGNIFIFGVFNSVVDFDPGPGEFELDGGHMEDSFLAKYDPDGNLIWVNQLGGANTDNPLNFILDADDNCIVSIVYYEEIDADPGPGTARHTADFKNILLAKYTNDGEYLWSNDYDINHFGNRFLPLATDNSNNIYFGTVFMEDSIVFQKGNPLSVLSGSSSLFICKLNPMGEFQWVSSGKGKSSYKTISSICIGNHNDVYITGNFSGNMLFESKNTEILIHAPDDEDAFLAKLDVEGEFEWAKNVAGEGEDYGAFIKSGSQEFIYLSGTHEGRIDIFSIPDPPGEYQFIAKLDTSGTVLWSTSFPGRLYEFMISGDDKIVAGIGGDPDPSVNGLKKPPMGYFFISTFSQTNIHGQSTNLQNSDTLISDYPDDKEPEGTIVCPEIDSCVLDYSDPVTFFYIENLWKEGDKLFLQWLIVQEQSFHRLITEQFYPYPLAPEKYEFHLSIACSETNRSSHFLSYADLGFLVLVKRSETIEYPISIFPNPVREILNIQKAGGADIYLYSVTGQLVYSQKNIEDRTNINLNSFEKGIYLLRLRINSHSISRLIIKR